MAQDFTDPVIPLPSTLLFNYRGLINDALVALRGLHSGTVAPTDTESYMLWADTTAGLLKQRNAADSAWGVLWTLGAGPSGLTRVAKSALFTVWAGDSSTVREDYYACTGTYDVTLVAATATDAAAGRLVIVKNVGAGTITMKPDGSDTIEGGASLALAVNDAVTLISDGTSDWEIL